MMIGYKYSATGVFGYEYFEGETKILSVSSVFEPSPPVIISGLGFSWESRFDHGITIVPGIKRYILDKEGNEIADIEYKEKDSYVIDAGITVFIDSEKMCFYKDNKVIATLIRIDKTRTIPPKYFENSYYDYEPSYAVELNEKIDHRTLTLILAFPLLIF